MTSNTRYRVRVGDSTAYRDSMPSDDELATMRHAAEQRGYSVEVHRCVTTIDTDAPSGHKVILNDTLLFSCFDANDILAPFKCKECGAPIDELTNDYNDGLCDDCAS